MNKDQKKKKKVTKKRGIISPDPQLRTHAVKILKKLKKYYPNAKCELNYKTPYQLLIAVILSAQTTDKMVNKATEALFSCGVEPKDIIALGVTGFYEKIKSLGLAQQKAKNIISTSQMILDNYAGKIPNSREMLEKFPGVGRKTASVVLGEIYHQPTLAVDTHVFRVTQRLGLHEETKPEKCEDVLISIIPKSYLPLAHHLFIWHGRYSCKARSPNCAQCPLFDTCPYPNKT